MRYSEPTTESNNFVITNKKKDPTLAKRTIEVTKIWKDNTGRIVNKTATGLSDVKIYLKINGTKQDSHLPTNPITEIEEDEIPLAPPTPPTLPTIKEETPEIELDGDEVPLGYTKIKRTLAKSGGLLVSFKYVFIALLVLCFAFVGTEFFIRKRNKKK